LELPLPTAEIRQKKCHGARKLIAPIADKSFPLRVLRYLTASIRISFDSGIFRAVTVEKSGLAADRQRNFGRAIFGRTDAAAVAAEPGLAVIGATSARRPAIISRHRYAPGLKPFAVTRRHGLDPSSKHHRRERPPGAAKARRPEMIGFHLLIRQYLTLTDFIRRATRRAFLI
jgi:hypothetical protein